MTEEEEFDAARARGGVGAHESWEWDSVRVRGGAGKWEWVVLEFVMIRGRVLFWVWKTRRARAGKGGATWGGSVSVTETR